MKVLAGDEPDTNRNGTIAAVINLADFAFIKITKVGVETTTCKFEIKKSPLKRGK